MSRNSARNSSAHFLALRRRLDAMGYADYPLGLDSAPLAQIMLEDLVATTEALRESEESNDGVYHKLEIAEQLLEPLQEENSKLRRDNTQLHKELISVGEESLKLQNKQATTQFQLQAENRRLTLSKQQVEEQLDLAKQDLIAAKVQLAQALEPTTSKISSRAPSEKSRRKSSSKDSISNISASSFLSTSQVDVDAVPKAEFDQLTNENDYLKQQVNQLSNALEESKACVKLRDEEIDRLGTELNKETGRNGFLITLRHKCQKAEEEVERLRTQVRLINPSGIVRQDKSDKKTKSPRKPKLQIAKPIGVDIQLTNSEDSKPQIPQIQNIKQDNDLVESLLAKIDQKESVIAELTSALAFVGDNLNRSMLSDKNNNILSDIEAKMRDMQNHYELEIEKLTKQLNQNGFSSVDPEVAKLMANTSNLDNTYSGKDKNSLREIEDLKRKLNEANEKLRAKQDTDSKYQSILEQLRREHQAMKKEIAQKTAELEKYKGVHS
ncbi:hypothetical protein TVAG_018980 [Trichomonas vaginalis G3]|uniref:Uncharacterized protein n=1 Tax=Trichomonas vaginalis (strain ATCC PRA-98 / G3) TaxID=412133 RepID=A2G498_TRIV3|nr:hypothetical protein TVAGG3_0215670 [Trichomonas vaginalis G3]EAX88026.1 hypothetical protein TVAG_018980 [Trichomonas vaginalis G3]KAI5551545.1 hypothetical protein TVAGG3_0215670 [Trichomonas vaginalis G3]|eukprot:XP_001300956.1 hypothetical protein [Trichomonas vaginalis G3]